MIETQNVSLQYGKRILFDDVNIKFTGDNCYGIIGANGAGKSTFLKILAGELDPNSGLVMIEPGKRMAVLSQDHYAFDTFNILDTVIMGHKVLWDIMKKKDAIYAKEDFSEADGLKASELEGEFAEMDGWNAESDAAALLSGLGIEESMHYSPMTEVSGNQKVRVLLAQALFGNPDILILDEPTNDLDVKTISWLEDFLLGFRNTVIVVSHDRHFLDTICTNIVDIDFSKLTTFSGNYTFWYESSQLVLKQRQTANKKAETKKKELQEFVQRFSANASKSKQATSRKKLLEKINLDDIKASSRRYPGIIWTQGREAGNQLLKVENLSYQDKEGNYLFKDVNFVINKGDKISFLGESRAISTLFELLNYNLKPSSGEFEFGQTITTSYLPSDNTSYFKSSENLVDWLRNYTIGEKDEVYIRGFLGKMLFSGEEVMKKCSVLSGGEKMRCMLSKMMQGEANLMMFDEPTNHLDLESITALNDSLIDFKGTILFTSHDHTFTQTTATRLIEIGPKGMLDKVTTYDEYLESNKIMEQRDAIQ